LFISVPGLSFLPLCSPVSAVKYLSIGCRLVIVRGLRFVGWGPFIGVLLVLGDSWGVVGVGRVDVGSIVNCFLSLSVLFVLSVLIAHLGVLHLLSCVYVFIVCFLGAQVV
jgi:hypothetical protein